MNTFKIERLRTFTVVTFALFASISFSQENLDITNVKSYSKDSQSIQNILDAYYDCISGPIGEKRDFDRLRNLFHPEARLIYSYWNEDTTKANLMVFNTLEDFIDKLGYLDKKGFYEHEISNIVHSFSSVNQVFSTYTFRVEDQSIPTNKGITSYEIFFDGARYWIMSMFWAAENNKHKIPQQYLIKQ